MCDSAEESPRHEQGSHTHVRLYFPPILCASRSIPILRVLGNDIVLKAAHESVVFRCLYIGTANDGASQHRVKQIPMENHVRSLVGHGRTPTTYSTRTRRGFLGSFGEDPVDRNVNSLSRLEMCDSKNDFA